MRGAADQLSNTPGPAALASVREVHRLLTEQLLPHEYAEEHQLYPALASSLGGPETTATMSRAHAEDPAPRRTHSHAPRAQRDRRRTAPRGTPTTCVPVDGLHSVLRLDFTQEEENYFSLAP